MELQYDPIGGWVDTTGPNPAIAKLVSHYRGKLYVATASVVALQIDRVRFRSASITDTCDLAVFKLGPRQTVVSHPHSRLFSLRFDSLNSGYRFNVGGSQDIAFTQAGMIIAIWPTDLTVLPGPYNPCWDDPGLPSSEVPPAFELVYLTPSGH